MPIWKIIENIRGVFQKYNQLSEKKRDAFYDKHAEQTQSYQDAKKYFDAVMNGRTKLPIKKWQAEQRDLLAEKYLLCEEYYGLKDEVKSVEVLRKELERLLREENFERQPTKANDIEL